VIGEWKKRAIRISKRVIIYICIKLIVIFKGRRPGFAHFLKRRLLRPHPALR
jgi:hypothetical protein